MKRIRAHSDLTARSSEIVLSILVLLIVAQVAWSQRGAWVPEVPMAEVAVGDTLPNVSLLDKASGSEEPERSRVHLRALVPERCAIIAFFDSQCAIAHDVAPEWSYQSHVIVAADSIPVHWVQIRRSDREATEFMRRHNLAARWSALSNRRDLAALGVQGTPRFYLVDSSMVFHGLTERSPDRIEVPPFCLSERE